MDNILGKIMVYNIHNIGGIKKEVPLEPQFPITKERRYKI